MFVVCIANMAVVVVVVFIHWNLKCDYFYSDGSIEWGLLNANYKLMSVNFSLFSLLFNLN